MNEILIRYLFNTEKTALPEGSEICSILGLFDVNTYISKLGLQEKNYAQNNPYYHFMSVIVKTLKK